MKHHLGHGVINIPALGLIGRYKDIYLFLHVSSISISMPASKWHSHIRAHRHTHTHVRNNSTGWQAGKKMRLEQRHVVTHMQPNYATTQFAIPPSMLMTSCSCSFSLLLFHHPVQPPPPFFFTFPFPSFFPSSPLLHPLTWETGTSSWFIMCLSVRLASPVLLRLPPGVIQSSPLLNPTAQSQWFRPPRTISGLLSICHGKACQNDKYRSLSAELWWLKWSLDLLLKHESNTPTSPLLLEHSTHERDCAVHMKEILLHLSGCKIS